MLKCENTDESNVDEKHTVKKSLKQGDVNNGIETVLAAYRCNSVFTFRKLTHFSSMCGGSFCTGFARDQSQLAFSPPTSAGKVLASSYAGTTFLAYKPINGGQ